MRKSRCKVTRMAVESKGRAPVIAAKTLVVPEQIRKRIANRAGNRCLRRSVQGHVTMRGRVQRHNQDRTDLRDEQQQR